MYLFNKRTRNVIKVFWGIFATLVIISMVFTYSGFTTLTSTTPTEPREITQDDLQYPATSTPLDVSTLSTSSPELQPLFESIRKDLESSGEGAPEETASPDQPAPPPLQFGL